MSLATKSPTALPAQTRLTCGLTETTIYGGPYNELICFEADLHGSLNQGRL